MNREETATVLMAMAAAWPWHEVGHATVLVWQSHLGSVRFDDAMATANLLIANDDRFPSVGRFRSELRNVVARRVRAERFQLAPPAGDRPDPATAAERLSELRARLAATGTEPGWKTDEKEDARDG